MTPAHKQALAEGRQRLVERRRSDRAKKIAAEELPSSDEELFRLAVRQELREINSKTQAIVVMLNSHQKQINQLRVDLLKVMKTILSVVMTGDTEPEHFRQAVVATARHSPGQ
jgi:predicted amino acid racemase